MINQSNNQKVPPQALDLEKAILGALILEADAIFQVSDILKPEYFSIQSHQKIYEAIQRLDSDKSPIDLLTVTEELRKSGDLEVIGGPYSLIELTDRVVSASNVEYHTRIIHQKYIAREALKIASTTIKELYSEETDVFESLDKMHLQTDSLTNKLSAKKEISIGQASEINLKKIIKIRESGNETTGIKSGLTDIDKITKGWQASDLIIIAARPAVGKTSFALTMAVNMAIHQQNPGVFYSLEMPTEQLTNRVISIITDIPLGKIRSPQELTDGEINEIQNITTALQYSPLYIEDLPSLSIQELKTKARRAFRQKNIKWIMIDYLQLMKGEKTKNSIREQEVSSISRELKALAKELNIPVIALAQLSRNVEARADKRPMLSDLRESGSIEQDADIVSFLYRKDYYEKDNIDPFEKGLTQLIIAKHRNGATGEPIIKFKAATTAFHDDSYVDFKELKREEYNQDEPF